MVESNQMDKDGCFMERRGGEVFDIGLVRSSSFGSKRIALTSNDIMELDFYNSTPTKKLCSAHFQVLFFEKSPLECLPSDILIQVLCGVEHDDLRNLMLVSKTINQATEAAKALHFLYTTPRKTVGFRDGDIADDLHELNGFGALAPKALKFRSSLSKKKLSDFSLQLFPPDTETSMRAK